MKNIVIIGAGAAGLMTAATILETSMLCHPEGTKDLSGNDEQILPSSEGQNQGGCHIHLFEKNTSPGKKVIISGGGRCNVTTGITDKKILATKYTRGWEFIERAMGKFSPKKCREWFEAHGVPLKCEEDHRVFPISDDGHDVVGAFERLFEKYRDKITLHYGEEVSEVSVVPVTARSESVSVTNDVAIQVSEKTEHGLLRPSQGQIQQKGEAKYQITTPKGSYEADVLVITTGGNAYSHTGSTGDGYAFARALGHTVTPLGPSLSSFLTRETWLHALSGLAFEDARISTLIGPLLLTHFGISGPLTFMTSSHLAFEDIGKGRTHMIHLIPRANMDGTVWDNFLKESFLLHPKKLITSILSEKLPKRFAEAFVFEYFSSIRETFAGSIGKKDRENIAELLGSGIPLTLLERRPGDEFVTAGGVSTDELDPETMESNIHKNLYFAGEILNVDGYTGGFSLQICWASGYSAGKSILKIL